MAEVVGFCRDQGLARVDMECQDRQRADQEVAAPDVDPDRTEALEQVFLHLHLHFHAR